MADTEDTIEKLKKMSLAQRVLDMTTEIKVAQVPAGSTVTPVARVDGLDWNGLVTSLQGKKIRITIDVLKEI